MKVLLVVQERFSDSAGIILLVQEWFLPGDRLHMKVLLVVQERFSDSAGMILLVQEWFLPADRLHMKLLLAGMVSARLNMVGIINIIWDRYWVICCTHFLGTNFAA